MLFVCGIRASIIEPLNVEDTYPYVIKTREGSLKKIFEKNAALCIAACQVYFVIWSSTHLSSAVATEKRRRKMSPDRFIFIRRVRNYWAWWGSYSLDAYQLFKYCIFVLFKIQKSIFKKLDVNALCKYVCPFKQECLFLQLFCYIWTTLSVR